ncbi:MAG: hypothetical protein QXD82_06185 [Nitrososphaerales archaeon]
MSDEEIIRILVKKGILIPKWAIDEVSIDKEEQTFEFSPSFFALLSYTYVRLVSNEDSVKKHEREGLSRPQDYLRHAVLEVLALILRDKEMMKIAERIVFNALAESGILQPFIEKAIEVGQPFVYEWQRFASIEYVFLEVERLLNEAEGLLNLDRLHSAGQKVGFAEEVLLKEVYNYLTGMDPPNFFAEWLDKIKEMLLSKLKADEAYYIIKKLESVRILRDIIEHRRDWASIIKRKDIENRRP